MASFKDKLGAEWNITLTVGALRRVLDMVDVDLARLVETVDANGNKRNPIQEWATLINDPIRVCDVLWAVVSPVAAARQITDEQFGELLEGQTLANATEALEQSLRDFFSALHPEFADMLRKMARFNRQGVAELSRRISDQLLGEDGMLKQAHARLDELLSATLTGNSGSGAAN